MDLPALGRPTKPMSARSLSSSRSLRATDGPPGVNSRGVCLVEVLKWVLPNPPFPPGATTMRNSGESISAIKSPVSSS